MVLANKIWGGRTILQLFSTPSNQIWPSETLRSPSTLTFRRSRGSNYNQLFTTDMDDKEEKMRSQCAPSVFYSPAVSVREITGFY